MLNNQKGFLLLESLLVLAIAASLLFIPPLLSRDVISATEGELFKQQLESSVTATQNYAVLSGKMTKIELSKQNKHIKFSLLDNPSHSLNHRLIFPESVSALSTTKVFHFLGGSGNIRELDSMAFTIDGKRAVFKFQMGSGRYEWE